MFEKAFKKKITEIFDVIVGTSIGGIVVGLLSCDIMSLKEIIKMLDDNCEEIFDVKIGIDLSNFVKK